MESPLPDTAAEAADSQPATDGPMGLAVVPCSAPDHCEVCGLDVPENEPLYWCEVCGQNHCDHCGDSWDGDDEDDEDFAGMYLECVCDHCLAKGFVPPESARRAQNAEHSNRGSDQ